VRIASIFCGLFLSVVVLSGCGPSASEAKKGLEEAQKSDPAVTGEFPAQSGAAKKQ
jgi:hypothetical protein